MNRLFILTFWCVICLLLAGCNQKSELEDITELKDITKFSTEKKGDYLLFHLIDPFAEEGYISEVQDSGAVVFKHTISDNHFAPSDVFQYNDNFYFASGAYSNDTKIMKYSPTNNKLSLLDTNQKQFIEKYYNDGDSGYIVTVIDQDNRNNVCDIQSEKCVEFSDKYVAHDVTILNNDVFVVGIDKNATVNKKNVVVIKKFNRNLELIKETYLDFLPNYFTYTSPDQKLYLFMVNGDIVEVDSNLKTDNFTINLSNISKNITRVNYHKNVRIDRDKILVNVEIEEPKKSIKFLAEISFENGEPQMKIIENSSNESILNVDSNSKEVYTRSYTEEKTVINIRDTETLKVKNKIHLENKDPIYFVDNIK